jgi:hypothetical protein
VKKFKVAKQCNIHLGAVGAKGKLPSGERVFGADKKSHYTQAAKKELKREHVLADRGHAPLDVHWKIASGRLFIRASLSVVVIKYINLLIFCVCARRETTTKQPHSLPQQPLNSSNSQLSSFVGAPNGFWVRTLPIHGQDLVLEVLCNPRRGAPRNRFCVYDVKTVKGFLMLTNYFILLILSSRKGLKWNLPIITSRAEKVRRFFRCIRCVELILFIVDFGPNLAW